LWQLECDAITKHATQQLGNQTLLQNATFAMSKLRQQPPQCCISIFPTQHLSSIMLLNWHDARMQLSAPALAGCS
jgi:hypothetical protein